ncbi:hypothetical protein HDV02_004945 [Globomyces sp. JEL0801]|nr:hypothetical protein HDV02_004945 [Globomyces sp. JEL0801]
MPNALANKWNKVKKWDYEGTLHTKNFEIQKNGRFSARFFQIALAMISYYWLGSQNPAFTQKYELTAVIGSMTFFAIASPAISAALIAVYITPWFGKNWTSRRILLIETFCDLFITIGWIAGFFTLLSSVTTGCSPANWIVGCTNFNWMAAWVFFLFLSWAIGLFFDGTAWYRGVFSQEEIGSDVLLDIRRTTRTRGH